MATSLLETFQGLDTQTKLALADIAAPLLLSLAALELAERNAGVDRLTVEHIVACLEAAGVAVKRLSVSRALSRAGRKISATPTESPRVFRRLGQLSAPTPAGVVWAV